MCFESFSAEAEMKAAFETASPESAGIHPDSIADAEMRMQKYIDDGEFAGISTAVVKNGKMIQRADFGFADIETRTPMQRDAIFRIFSMSKPITAAGLMILFDEGRLKLDDKVSAFIPEFESTPVYMPDGDSYRLVPQERALTIRHLLTHTSGIAYNGRGVPLLESLFNKSGVRSQEQTLQEQMSKLASIPLAFQPGTAWQYGYSLDAAGYLIEVISGQPLDRFLKERIFDPLGMIDTGFFVPEEKRDRLTSLYRKQDGNLVKAGGDGFTVPPRLFAGGSGLVSTMNDYIRFSEMLLNGGTVDGKRILSEDAVKLIVTDQLPENVKCPHPNFLHGLGGVVDSGSGEYGWSGACSTYFRIDPQNHLLILTMTQFTPNAHETYGVAFRNAIRNGFKK
jgi:CubicO group peptidase (beta-lactamase class C family)